jgi:hypothetical protein
MQTPGLRTTSATAASRGENVVGEWHAAILAQQCAHQRSRVILRRSVPSALRRITK